MIAVQAIEEAFTERMLNSVVDGLAIALFAWILLRLLGRQNSSTRFMVWFLALVVIAALPLVNFPVHGASGFVPPAEFVMPTSWAAYLVAGWVFLACAGLIHLAGGLWQLRSLRRSCLPLDIHPSPGQTRRRVKICRSAQVRVPAAVGFFDPTIILPNWATEELSPAELHSIVLHELAHLRRCDDWTNLLQRIIQALLFFHPAVWWIAQQLTLEREIASDDLVLEQTCDPHAYAECLVSVAERSLLHRGATLAQAVVGRMRQTRQRIAQILDQNRLAATRVFKPALILLATFSCLCLLWLNDGPRLIGFANSTVPGPVMVAERLPATLGPATVQFDAANLAGAKFTRTGHKAELRPMAARRSRGNLVQRGLPLLVRAKRREEIQPPRALLLLVVEHAQFDQRAMPVWRLSLWHVMVISPCAERTNAARL